MPVEAKLCQIYKSCSVEVDGIRHFHELFFIFLAILTVTWLASRVMMTIPVIYAFTFDIFLKTLLHSLNLFTYIDITVLHHISNFFTEETGAESVKPKLYHIKITFIEFENTTEQGFYTSYWTR